jgi:hypothetical protein
VLEPVLVRLRYQVEDEGYEEGTPAFEQRLLALRVGKCQEMQNVTTCQECRAFDSCEMAHEYLRQKKYGPQTPE